MNEEPIEIKFVINSPEVLEQAMQLENSLKGVDSAVAKSEKNFDNYVKSQLDANLSIAENIKLTDAQKRAFETYTRTISGFHEMMKETTDPTYIAMYQYKIEEAIESVNRLTSREKSELIDTAKLEEAGRLLDSISDKTFTPDFASNKELELLSERINGAKDEFEQLGVVLDFVQAKMGGISDKSTFDKINVEIQQANDLLGRNVQQYDATGNSIAEMTDALKLFQEQLASETDTEKIKQLNANIEELENNIKRLSNIGKTGFDELGNKIVEQTEQAKGLKGQLADLVQQLAKLRMEGKANTDQYAELSRQATQLRGAISLVNEEISQSSSTTSGLDTLIRATKGIASGYAIAKSASSLFGKDQKDVEQAILKVTSAMSLLQGLQVIQAELLRKEGLATKSLTYLKNLYTKAVGESTGAMKTFKVALLASGIGVFIVLLGELIANWDKVKRSIGLTSDELERTQAIGKKANDLYGEQIAKLRMLAATNKEVVLTDEQKKKAVKDFNKEFGDTLGTAKDYADLEDRIIKNAPKYIEYLQLKAQAEASYMLSLEKQKNLLEQITALSTGDLQWYDKLQDYSDKAFEGIYKLLGIDIGETKREITQSEILHIIGLPSEEQFNEALKGYSSVVQGNLKKFREQQQRDSALFQASFDLQEQAGKMAQAEGIKSNDKEAEAAAKKAFQDKVKALADIAKAENEFEKNRLNGLDKELKEIENRYNALRQKAKEAKLDAKEIERINSLERKEKASASYNNETAELIKRLESEKELFRAYEELKTKIGSEELVKRYESELRGFKDFKSVIESEITKVESVSEHSEQKTRVKALREMLQEAEKSNAQNEEQKYLDAYQAVLTFEEKKSLIEAQYRADKSQLEKIQDATLRDAKINELDALKAIAINNLRHETYEKRIAHDQLTEHLIGLSKKELKSRIAALNEYVILSDETLTTEQESLLNNAIIKAKSLMSSNELSQQEKSLLLEKEKIESRIQKIKIKSNEAVGEEIARLSEIRSLLLEIEIERTQGILEDISDISNSIAQVGAGLKNTNSELGEAIEQTAEWAAAFGNILSKIASGDYIGAIVSAVASIGKAIADIGRRSEKAQQELEKLRREAFKNQIEYNRAIREQLKIEQEISDMYKARSVQIREMLSLLQGNQKRVGEDMQSIFEELLNTPMKTVEAYKNQLGMYARVAYVFQLLGYSFKEYEEMLKNGELPELTDELFEKLEQINREQPFTNNSKELFEMLKKLKEEFGSIDEAMRELHTEYVNKVTGTTASALADSIAKGLASGKRSFEDFASDIEGFLRNAILSSLNYTFFGEQVAELQKALAEMMEDGSLTDADVKKFQDMYMSIVNDAQEAMDMLNQAGIDLSGGSSDANSLKGAIKGMTEQQADLLAGQMGGWRLAQLETNSILKTSFSSTLFFLSRQVGLQMQIEINTRSISEVTQKILDELKKNKTATMPTLINPNAALAANGLWTE